MGNEYNNALLAVENNSMGQAVVRMLLQYNYPNIYYTNKNQDDLSPGRNKRYVYDPSKMIPGFSTTSKNRPLMIQKVQLMMQQKQVIIRSKRLLNQFDTFV